MRDDDGLVKLVDDRFKAADEFLRPGQGARIVCDHAEAEQRLLLCPVCVTWLHCRDCYSDHWGPAHSDPHCEACGAADESPRALVLLDWQVGVDALPVRTVDGSRSGWWTLPVDITGIAAHCPRVECKRRFAEALAAAAALPAEPGSGDIRECERGLAERMFAELADA